MPPLTEARQRDREKRASSKVGSKAREVRETPQISSLPIPIPASVGIKFHVRGTEQDPQDR